MLVDFEQSTILQAEVDGEDDTDSFMNAESNLDYQLKTEILSEESLYIMTPERRHGME